MFMYLYWLDPEKAFGSFSLMSDYCFWSLVSDCCCWPLGSDVCCPLLISVTGRWFLAFLMVVAGVWILLMVVDTDRWYLRCVARC